MSAFLREPPPPPPPPKDNSSPEPPAEKNSPPSDDNNKNSPPPDDDYNFDYLDEDTPPPPPHNNNNSKNSPPPPPNDNNSEDSPPPPPPNDNNSEDSPPPPPPNDNNSNDSPPPPPLNNNNSKDSPSPPSDSHPPPGRSSPPPPPPGRGASALSSNGHSPPALAPSSDDGAQKSVIAGAAVGAGLLLLMLIAILLCCCTRKKRKRQQHMKYYRENSHGTDYFDSGPNDNWHNPNHKVKIPPTPDSAAVSSEPGWRPGPAPSPPMMNSSELSSGGFSGPHHSPLPPPHPGVALGFNQSSFKYDDLAAATKGFSQANLLGQGGFGFVHKGVLPNGKEIAVKSLKANSGQGEREFQAEVDIISRVHHKHLVSLVGYCIAGSQRMLVFEFVSNGTLEYHLHGSGRPAMDWPTRLKIAMGSAKGFAYLHEDCHPSIIHRDIKAANILLEDNFEAKVADFGLAKLSSGANNTFASTRLMGTFGYLAPEYAQSGKLTEKSDVYSYGIVLLELITGRRPIDTTMDDEDTLIEWARPILIQVSEGGSFESLVDPRLENNYDPHEMFRMVACAGACIRHSARRRPKMSQIVRALEGDVSLDDLAKPGAALSGSRSNSEYDFKKFEKGGALSNPEFSSGRE